MTGGADPSPRGTAFPNTLPRSEHDVARTMTKSNCSMHLLGRVAACYHDSKDKWRAVLVGAEIGVLARGSNAMTTESRGDEDASRVAEGEDIAGWRLT